MRNFHRWIGTVAAVLLMLVGVTGVLLQIEQVRDEPQKEALEQAAARVFIGDPVPDLAGAWAEVGRAAPGTGVRSVEVDLLGNIPIARFHLQTGRRLSIDLASHRLIHDEPDEAESFLLRLHTGEVFGDGGVVLGLCWGLALVALVITGAVVYLQLLGRRRQIGRRSLFWSVLLALMLVAPTKTSQAGSPFLTDDPGFIASGWEVKLALARDENQSGTTWTAPVLDLNYTVTEHFKWNLTLAGRRVDPDSGGSATGVADTDLKFKWRFRDETPSDVAMSIAPNFTMPTASKHDGLGDGVLRLRLPVQFGKTFGRWYGFAETGYQFAFNSSASDAVIYGAGAQVTLNPKWTVGAELNGGLATRDRDNWGLLGNFGATYQASNRLQLQGSIGRTVRDIDRGGSRLLTQFFLQWQFP